MSWTSAHHASPRMLQAYLAFGDEGYLRMFVEVYAAAMQRLQLAGRWASTGWLADMHIGTGQLLHPWISSLSAFWPGLQVLAGQQLLLPSTRSLAGMHDGAHQLSRPWILSLSAFWPGFQVLPGQQLLLPSKYPPAGWLAGKHPSWCSAIVLPLNLVEASWCLAAVTPPNLVPVCLLAWAPDPCRSAGALVHSRWLAGEDASWCLILSCMPECPCCRPSGPGPTGHQICAILVGRCYWAFTGRGACTIALHQVPWPLNFYLSASGLLKSLQSQRTLYRLCGWIGM